MHFSFGYQIKYLLLLVHRDIHHENNPVDGLLSAITRRFHWCEWPRSNLCCHWTELPEELLLQLSMVESEGWIQLIKGKLPSEENATKKSLDCCLNIFSPLTSRKRFILPALISKDCTDKPSPMHSLLSFSIPSM